MENDGDFLIANQTRIYPNLQNYNSVEAHQEAPRIPSKKLPQYIATIAATLSAFSAGIVLGWTSPIETYLEQNKYKNITINHDEMGWIGSLTTLGALLTCIPTGFVCDILGRKTTLILLFFPYSLGWVIIMTAKNIIMLYIGRFVMGMAAGACCVAAPMYTSEIAQKEIRGSLGSYFQLMVTIGVLYAYIFGAILSINNYMIACCAIPCIFVVIFSFQPESPLYLIKKGKYEKAKSELMRLRGTQYDPEEELAEIETTIKASQQSVGVIRALNRTASRKAVFISLSLMFFQQFSGINAVIFYTSDIFEKAGVAIDPNVATIIVGAFQVIATFISSLIVDRLGRKSLLIFSATFMSISLLFLGLFFVLKDHAFVHEDTIKILSFLPILSLVIYVIMFSIGLGPIPWLMSGEIFAPEVKGFASSVSGSFNWFLAFLITKFYPEISKNIGSDVTFAVFGVIMIFASIFIYYFVLETKGKTISEIQEELEH